MPEVPSNVVEMYQHVKDALLESDIRAGMLDDVRAGADRPTGAERTTGSGRGLLVRYQDGATYLISVHQIAVGREPDDPDAE